MTKEEAERAFKHLREATDAILALAARGMHPTDQARARAMLNLDMIETFARPEPALRDAMLRDLGLFEPSRLGVTRFERYLAKPKPKLPDTLAEHAYAMGKGYFSMFTLDRPHESGGFWIRDVINKKKRPFWLMAEPTDHDADAVAAVRIFDAGPFWLTLGPPVFPDAFSVELARHNSGDFRTPWRKQPFAAAQYEIALSGDGPPDPDWEELEAIAELLDAAWDDAKPAPARPSGRPPRRT
jgi:hypothetical protein